MRLVQNIPTVRQFLVKTTQSSGKKLKIPWLKKQSCTISASLEVYISEVILAD